MERFHPIGVPGEPWGERERRQWFEAQRVQRSYRDEVLDRIDIAVRDSGLGDRARVIRYGALPIDRERYPLLAVEVGDDDTRPSVLVTGGVHGYETSGVQGALAFLRQRAAAYADRVNLLVAPCVSPWGYEVVNRWNPNAVDPNRSFVADGPSEEAAALMSLVADRRFLVHIDLHETTDTDESEFRPALAARDGVEFVPGSVPDGFYTVGDSANPQPEFQAAIVTGVEQVTHIAPPDDHGQIFGTDVVARGVIEYPCRDSGLCAGMTDARFVSTTEVYPDSTQATPQLCIDAQVAAVCAGLDHALAAS